MVCLLPPERKWPGQWKDEVWREIEDLVFAQRLGSSSPVIRESCYLSAEILSPRSVSDECIEC